MSNWFNENDVEYVGPFNMDEEDKNHISRLKALRETGSVNMFTDLRRGLVEVWPEDGEETYQWVQDNWDYYLSGNWTDQDLQNL